MFPVEGKYDDIVLREVAPEDEPALESLFADMGSPPTGQASGAGWLSHGETTSTAVPRDDYMLAIEVDGEMTGVARLQIDSRSDGRGEIGYAVRRQFRGRGYATRAVMALTQFGFREVGLHRLWAVCDVENVASAGVLSAAGFEREGRLRHDRWDGERWRDSLLFALLDEGSSA